MGVTYFEFDGDTGLDPGVIIRSRTTGKVWDGTAMVEEAVGTMLDLLAETPVPETETGSGHYRVRVPSGLPADKLFLSFRSLSDGEAFQQGLAEWDGSSLVDDLVTGASIADICNMALSHIGVGTEIANLTTDRTANGSALRRFYDKALEQVLRAGSWPFATRIVELGLLTEDPNDDWGFSYRTPTNVLKVVKIVSGVRPDTRESLIPFRAVGDDSGGIIYTDQEDAQAEVRVKVTNPLRFPPDFVMAFSALLAFYVAPRLAGASKTLRDEAWALYNSLITEAKVAAANDSVPDLQSDSSFVDGRE